LPGLLASVVLFSLVFPGCSAVVDSGRNQCATDLDCTERGGAFAGSKCVEKFCHSPNSDQAGPWGCLGNVTWPATTPGTHNVSVVVADIITNKPVAGLSARLCYKLDPTCLTPMVSDLVSDSEGRMGFTVPTGFDGFLESTGSEAFPFSYFFYPPVTADRVVSNVPVLHPGALATFSALVGAELLPDRGHILARVYNCLGKTAEGIRYSTSGGDGSTVPFYMIAGMPSTRESATDSAGNGGLLNVPTGSATLIGTVVASGRTLGSPLSMVVRPGRISYTGMVPSP
jgi:hypothetical protein